MNGLEQRPALAPQARLRSGGRDNESVLLFPEGVLVLNETAHAVIRHCDGQNTVHRILEMLASDYDVEQSELEQDVCDCLRDLEQRKLVVWQS